MNRSNLSLKHKALAGLAVVVALSVGATTANAAGPVEYLKKQTTTIEKLLRQPTPEGSAALARKKAKLKKILRGMLNYNELARASLWIHWKDRSAKQRKEFTNLLRQLIEDRVLSNITDQVDFTVEYAEPVVEGKNASVKMVVRIPNKPEVDIEYKMTKRGAKWWTNDLITDGTSLVRNYRSQFNRIIKKDGYEHLVKKMKEKLEKPDTGGGVASAG